NPWNIVMVDIYLNPATNDIDLANNTMRLTETTEESTRQRVLITLNTNRGEWKFNISFGVPWLSNEDNPIQLLGRTPKYIIDAAVKEAILSRKGIISLNSYSSETDKQTRIMTISFRAETEEGEIITVNDNISI